MSKMGGGGEDSRCRDRGSKLASPVYKSQTSLLKPTCSLSLTTQNKHNITYIQKQKGWPKDNEWKQAQGCREWRVYHSNYFLVCMAIPICPSHRIQEGMYCIPTDLPWNTVPVLSEPDTLHNVSVLAIRRRRGTQNSCRSSVNFIGIKLHYHRFKAPEHKTRECAKTTNIYTIYSTFLPWCCLPFVHIIF